MTSMLAGEVPKAKVSTILAANKVLRFAKANSDVRLRPTPTLPSQAVQTSPAREDT